MNYYRKIKVLNKQIFIPVAIILFSSSSDSKLYCEEFGNKCTAVNEYYEKGKTTSGLFFVLRPDGSGCFGRHGTSLDCSSSVFTKNDGYRPWLISCYKDVNENTCIATDTSSSKIRFGEDSGWRIGVGHNNYLDSPVRLKRRNGKFDELKSNDGWVSRTEFAKVYQFMTDSKDGYLEWVSEEFVQIGPKWNPGSPDARALAAVFSYATWATTNKLLKQVTTDKATDFSRSKRQDLNVLDCYWLRLGANFTEATNNLGVATSIKDEFVDSAGVRGVTVSWQSADVICDARFAPDLTRYSITDTQNLRQSSSSPPRK